MVTRLATLATACALISSTASAATSGDKEAAYQRMISIANQVRDLRAQQADPARIDALVAHYEALQARLGGDDPSNLTQGAPVPSELDPSAHFTPNAIVTPLCAGDLAPVALFLGAIGPLPDVATVSFPCPVGGLDDYLWDIDVNVAIQHTFAADLDIRLTSPVGNTVVISTDNGGANDDVFNGTSFDDTVNDPVTDHLYTNLVPVPTLSPEGRLAAFRGEDPNGLWTLTITDDAGGDVGVLNSFSLAIVAISTPPGGPASTFVRMPALPIVDLTTVSDAMPVAGLAGPIAKVVLYVEILHTFAADLDIQLVSPNGTQVTVSTDNGGANDNVFNGSTFDPDVLDPVTDHIYANLVTATPLSPEGSFDNFIGSNPNGLWQLVILDDAGGDVGVLNRWDLTIRICAAPGPQSYCTTGPTTNGCVAHISANENPSVTFANPCIVSVDEVEGQKTGLVFYGITGPHQAPWSNTSFLCVKAPYQRTPSQNTGGTNGLCDGAMTLDWNQYQLTHPGALGNPWSVGQKAWLQGWFRDPPNPKTTHMSDAVELTYQP